MRRLALFVAASVAVVSAIGLYAQQADSIASINNPPEVLQSVPRLIMFSGTLQDLTGKPLTGPVDFNFAIYKEQADAGPLWQESQTLNVDDQGHYTALLGAMQPEGLPVELFTTGEARWLGVGAGKLPEQPRVLLVSVPYALKANDAEMLAGKPASAYALAQPTEGITPAAPPIGQPAGGRAASPDMATPGKPDGGPKPNVTFANQPKYIPVTTGSDGSLGNSVMYQNGGNIGIGTTNPQATLDVAGRLGHFLVASSGAVFQFTRPNANYIQAATAGGFFDFVTNGRPTGDLYASLKLDTNGNVYFPLGNVGIGTTTPAQKLDVSGNLKITGAGNAIIFPDGTVQATAGTGSGGGTITGVTAGTGLTGGGTAGNVTLSLASSSCTAGSALTGLPLTCQPFATLGANTFTGTQTISSGDLSVSGGNISLPQTASASAGVINLGGSPLIHACCSASQHNTFLGANAGNFTTTGGQNTATGFGALSSNTTGSYNTASGYQALYSNTETYYNTASGAWALYSNTGDYNTAGGFYALGNNTTGADNTAIGYHALHTNTTGYDNTAVGLSSGYGNITGYDNTFIGHSAKPNGDDLTNATAIGAHAVVSRSNSLILGGTGTQAVKVGIGTSSPSQALEVVGNVKVSGSGNGITFPDGTTQTTVGGGGGGVTSVAAGTGLTASPNPITATGTISVDPTVVAELSNSNTFTTNQNIQGNLTVTGVTSTNILTVASTSQVSNLNASLLGGYSANAFRTRGLVYLAGCDNCSPLADNDDQKKIYVNVIGAMAITQVTCYSDAGTPTINVQRDDGTPANILPSALTCSPTGNSTTTFVAGENWLDVNQALNFVLVTAGGVAKSITLVIKAQII